MSSSELSIGMMATKLATAKAKQGGVDETMVVIRKTVLDMAEQGLFHCTMRFEDTLPQDKVNQEMLVKALIEQNLNGEFMHIDNGVQLHIFWGNWAPHRN
eukprot:TRINITY_DN11533_c0_g1_i1.p1 TRINITY_DN11533_c0_g1~~TRINITY_DN11533_c0_g1_i1.p1  ORF type:complete len:100 (+),score=20.97 TRINITY_DN11533_c0_g1_i1:26-325(+)